MRRVAAVVVMLLVAGGAACTSAPEGAPLVDDAEPGVTSRTLPGLQGGEVDLAGYRGTPLLINFFQHNCAPCLQEMPDLEAAYQAADGDFEIVGVASQDDPDQAQALADQLGVTWSLAADADGGFFVDAGANFLPTTLFVDAGGDIVDSHVGAMSSGDIASLLDEHFGIDVPG